MSGGPGGCPKCGTSLDGPSGLCGHCLLQLALGAPDAGDEPGFDERYVVVNILGHGPHGTTYLASDAGLPGTHVAVKVLAGVQPDELWRRRLEEFSASIGAVVHSAVAPVLDCGTDGHGRAFVVTEFVVGQSMLAHCARHRPALADRVRLFGDVAAAVAAAHDAGVSHGHLVEGNVLVPGNADRAVVTDFALAGLAGAPPSPADDHQALVSLFDLMVGDEASGATGAAADALAAIRGCGTARGMAAAAGAFAAATA